MMRITPEPWGEAKPNPRPGFETEFVDELNDLFSALPSGMAKFHLGRIPGHSDWPEPYFALIPTNSKAARFDGYACVDDLTIGIGGAEREFAGFAGGGTVVKGASWRDEFRWIWVTVLAGGFTHHHYLDSEESLIGWAGSLMVNGTEVFFRNGRRAERLFGQQRMRKVTYEPYRKSGE
jgi:hypothetical protein